MWVCMKIGLPHLESNMDWSVEIKVLGIIFEPERENEWDWQEAGDEVRNL